MDNDHNEKVNTITVNVYLWFNNILIKREPPPVNVSQVMNSYVYGKFISRCVQPRDGLGTHVISSFRRRLKQSTEWYRMRGTKLIRNGCLYVIMNRQPQDDMYMSFVKQSVFPFVHRMPDGGDSLVSIRCAYCVNVRTVTNRVRVDRMLISLYGRSNSSSFVVREGVNDDDFAHSKYVPLNHVIDTSKCYFICDKLLGSGEFGEVVHGGIRNGIEIAVKQPTTTTNFQQFGYECMLHESMHHPNIVPVIGRTESKKLLLKYCHGGTLESWIVMNRDTLSFSLLWRGCVELASALAYMHNKGVIHRDIKTNNVIVDEKGNWYFADLGLGARSCVLLHGSEDSNVNAAKYVRFASREEREFYRNVRQNLDTFGNWRQHASSSSDVFSFGFVLWYIFCGGSLGFWSNGLMTDADIENVILGTHPQGLSVEDCHDMGGPMFTDEIRELIRGCWQSDLKLRPSAQELLDSLWQMCPQSNEDARVIVNHKLCHQLFYMHRCHDKNVYIEPWCSEREISHTRWWNDCERYLSKRSATKVYHVRKVLHDFIDAPRYEDQNSVLLLMGEGGVGKTATLIDFSRELVKNSGGEKQWIVVLLRPALEYLYDELNNDSLSDGIANVLHSYHLNDNQIDCMQQHKVVFILDGFDEVSDRHKVRNLPSLLGMGMWPSSKLIVSCRPSGLAYRRWYSAFGAHCDYRFMLPFTRPQLTEFLSAHGVAGHLESHVWSGKLTNPYMLHLLVESPPPPESFRGFYNRADIYKSSMTKWAQDARELVDEVVNIENLVTKSLSISSSGAKSAIDILCDDMELGVSRLAFTMFESHVISLSKDNESVDEVWRKLICETIQTHALLAYNKRSPDEKDELLDPNQYGKLVDTCVRKWLSLCPLQYRKDGSWIFCHKSFQDWGAAMYVCREGIRQLEQHSHDDWCASSDVWWSEQLLSRLSLSSASDLLLFLMDFVNVLEASRWSAESSSTTFTSYLWRLVEAQCRVKKSVDNVNATFRTLIDTCGDNAMLLLSCAAEQEGESCLKFYENASGIGHPIGEFKVGIHLLEAVDSAHTDVDYGVELLRRACVGGHAEAQYRLGELYEVGECGVLKDTSKAVELFEMAMSSGHVGAVQKLLEVHKSGVVTLRNVLVHELQKRNEILSELRNADQDMTSQLRLGLSYYFGEGTDRNMELATDVFAKLSLQGDARAQCYLGECFEYGRGVCEDRELAHELYRMAASQGHARGQFNLGRSFQNRAGGGGSDTGDCVDVVDSGDWDYDTDAGDCVEDANTGDCDGSDVRSVSFELGNGVEKNSEVAVELYEMASKGGYGRATHALGKCYAKGIGVRKDLKAAFYLYKQSLKQGYELARLAISTCFRFGNGVQKDLQSANEMYELVVKAGCVVDDEIAVDRDTHIVTTDEMTADSGYARNLYICGLCCEYGIDVDVNIGRAVELYKLAAEQGDEGANFSLGECYEFGRGVDTNLQKAIELYKTAANQGDIRAQCSLGATIVGVKVEEDARITQTYEKAANQGYSSAQYSFGVFCENGNGVERNLEMAATFYKMAGNQNDSRALRKLGDCYLRGQGVPKDEEGAVKLYKMAGDQGDFVALRKLGDCNLRGQGVPKDEKRAVELYKVAGDQGAHDLRKLGDCYLSGQGVPKDEKRAVELYKMAGDQGDAIALRKLANCYLHGQGVSENAKSAVVLYKMAGDRGDAIALRKLADCYLHGQGACKDETRAVELYKMAGDEGTVALLELGECYLDEQGVSSDEEIDITTDFEIRNLLVLSIYHGGSTSMTQSLFDWRLCDEKGVIKKEWVLTGKRVIHMQSVEIKDGLILNVIDGGCLMDNIDEANKVIGLMPQINLVLICVKMGTWTHSMRRDYVKTLQLLRDTYKIPLEFVVPCFTHFDCRSVFPESLKQEYTQLTAHTPKRFAYGSFVNPLLLNEIGRKIYSVFGAESKARIFRLLVNSKANTRHGFKIGKIKVHPNRQSIKLSSKHAFDVKIFDDAEPEDAHNDDVSAKSVIFVAVSGRGKLSIINDLCGRDEISKSSLYPVTTELARVREIQVEVKSTKFTLSLGDTIGNTPEDLFKQIVALVQSDMPLLNLIAFTLKLQPLAEEIPEQEVKLVKSVISLLKLDKTKVLFIVTHSDFFSHEVRCDFRTLMKESFKLAHPENVLFVTTANPAEMDVRMKKFFKKMRSSGTTRIMNFVSKSNSHIEVAEIREYAQEGKELDDRQGQLSSLKRFTDIFVSKLGRKN